MKLDKNFKNNVIGNFLLRIYPNILLVYTSQKLQLNLYKNILFFHTLKEV